MKALHNTGVKLEARALLTAAALLGGISVAWAAAHCTDQGYCEWGLYPTCYPHQGDDCVPNTPMGTYYCCDTSEPCGLIIWKNQNYEIDSRVCTDEYGNYCRDNYNFDLAGCCC